MYTGSSAINSIQHSTIQSPLLKVEMSKNKYLEFSPGSSGIFATGSTTSYQPQLLQGIYFNDKLVLSMLDSTSAENLYLASYDTYGRTRLSYTYTGSSEANAVTAAAFAQDGSTLNFFYVVTVGSTQNIQRLSSADGQTWGGSVVINSRGVTNNNGWIHLAATGSSRLYAMRRDESGFSGQISSLWCFKNTSGSWSSGNTVYAGFITQAFPSSMSAFAFDYIDKIAFSGAEMSPTADEALRVITTDSVNVFQEFNLYPNNTNSATYSQFVGNFTYGNGVYRAWSRMQQRLSDFVQGAALFDNGMFSILETPDFERFAIETIIPGVSTGYALVINGMSDNDHVAIVTSNGSAAPVNVAFIQSGNSTLDVTSDVIKYSNQNNSRISISLGNYG